MPFKKIIKGNFQLNSMSHEELQEWTTKILCEAQCENAVNQNLELTRLYSTNVLSRVSHFERNAIDAAIAYHGLFMNNAHQETSTIDEEQQPPPVRRQRLWLPQSKLSNDLLIEPGQSKKKKQSHKNRNQDLYINEAVILETINTLGLRRTT
ncbi:uncharacterized protein LOC111082127 [Drosophila obscura]|uniref:uncharacterized protein LOC111082127 n=1 Tax=Drosophila obscura TaxID=7282 RepID=UPI000BA04033|nr:uncharacterized protein LOC111082127 [Drosophila obscura]